MNEIKQFLAEACETLKSLSISYEKFSGEGRITEADYQQIKTDLESIDSSSAKLFKVNEELKRFAIKEV